MGKLIRRLYAVALVAVLPVLMPLVAFAQDATQQASTGSPVVDGVVNVLPEPWGGILMFLLAIVGAASAASAYLPKSDGTGVYGFFRKVLDYVGHNFLNSTNKK